jgi:2-amino-4-hydroxy-6-hydroxymethyldihydropteridine pyrophosphokinase
MGDRGKNLSEALRLIEEAFKGLVHSPIIHSSVYETEAWGFESDDKFLNQAVAFDTDIDAELIMRMCLIIEKQVGRVRYGMNFDSTGNRIYESRNIDIDMMLYGDKIIDMEILKIPHPRLHEREFALLPLTEIAPGVMHPILHKSMRELLEEIRSKT